MANESSATINAIKITVSANTTKAKTNLDKLADSLKNLRAAIGEGFNLPDAATMNAFVTAMHGLKGVPWTRIANGLQKITDAMSGVNGGNVAQMTSAMQKIATPTAPSGAIDAGTTMLPKAADVTATGWDAMRGKLSSLGGSVKELGQTFANGLAPAVRKLEPVFAKVSSVATSAFSSAKSAVESFGNSVAQHVMPVVATVGGAISSAFAKASSAVSSFASTVGSNLSSVMSKASTTVSKFANDVWSKVSPAVTAVTTQIKGFATAGGQVAIVFAKTVGVVGSFAAILTTKLIGTVARAAAGIARLGMAIGVVLLSGIKKASAAIGSLITSVGTGLGGAAQKGAIGMGKLIGKIAIGPFKSAATSIAGLTAKLGGFLAGLKRIALYRAIRFVLKEITQAFKEGTSNLYQYSLAINGTFARSMDMLATSALYAKNSLAAMVAPLVNQLAPAVDYVVDKFVNLLNTLNELFATLTGAETWTKALKYPTQYAEAADGANGSAKKLRATLLGFDEINRLDDNRKGSRGSAADQLDYSKMFEEQVTTGRLKGVIEKFKEAFNEGDFTEIGRSLGEKLKKGLDSIPWAEIRERLRKNATSVATAINGFISVDGLAESIGRTIGEAFNTVTTKIQAFFGTVDWSKLGTFVGTSIDTALHTIDFAALGRTIFTVLKGAINFAKGLLGAIDWNNLGKKIGEFLNGIDFKQVLSDLADTFATLIGDAIDACWSLIKTSPLAGSLVIAALGLKVGGLLGSSMASGVAGSGLTGKISALIPTAATLAVTAVVGYKIGNKIYDSFSEEFKDELADTMGAIDDFFGDVLGLESEAYQLNKHNWDAAKDLTAGYYEKAKEGEIQHQWLVKQGYSEDTVHRAMQLKASMEQIDKQKELRETMGWQTDELTLQMERQRMLSKYTDDEIKAWMDLTKETIKINFEATFGSWEDITKKIKTAFEGAKSTIKNTFSGIGETLGGWIKGALGLDSVTKTLNNLSLGSGGTKSGSGLGTHKAYASGGTPQTGSLFIAGEAGAELVSSTGNRTTVSNRDQIAESVAAGNEEGNELLRELLSVGRSILAKDTTVVTNITTGQITSALDRQNRRSGRAIVPVGG